MSKHDFYVVDGCVDFVPVKRSTLTPNGVEVTIVGSAQKERVLVDRVYQMAKIFEPQKVVVPKFVAVWAENTKKQNFSLRQALEHWSMSEELEKWFQYSYNQDTFARAWMDGYEVEQEQLYTVEIPDPNSYCDYRYLSRNDKGICLDASNDTKWKQKKRNQFTESEIKQDFEWAWDAGFAEPVEVKEVE